MFSRTLLAVRSMVRFIYKLLRCRHSALRVLRTLGWVHRDVSTGNILSCDGHGKLADLEYAKKTNDLTTHEMRTASESPISLSDKPLIASEQGTKDFMSIEIAAQRFLFGRLKPRLTLDEVSERAERQDEGTTQTNVLFSPNHLHDLESLWWVAVWVVFYNHFGTSPSVTREDTTELLRLAQTLFPPMLESFSRRDGFKDPQAFEDTCAGLPSNKKFATAHLDFLRQLLIEHYTAIEEEYPKSVNPDSSDDKIYEGFKQAFLKIAVKYADLKLRSIIKCYEELLKGENTKRPRPDSTNDTESAKKNPRK
jgi:serine/threonine protein kinase